MGILLYVMLSNDIPFSGNEEILQAPIRFRALKWLDRSDQTKIFIRLILVRDPLLRPTVTELLRNDWFCPSAIRKAHEVMQIHAILPPPPPPQQQNQQQHDQKRHDQRLQAPEPKRQCRN